MEPERPRVARWQRHHSDRTGSSASPLSPWLSWALPTLLTAVLVLLLGGPFYVVQDEQYRFEIFQYLFVTQDVPAAVLMIVLLLVVGLLAQRMAPEPIVRWVRAVSTRPHALIWGTLLLLIFATDSVYHRHPLAQDEYAPTFQAQIFAAGELYGSFPPQLIPRLIPAWFINRFFLASPSTGNVVSAYWPGHALLLTPWAWLGIPWLLNPLLAALTLVLLWALARQIFTDPQAPGWVLLFTLASPDFLANAVSFYAMTAHLLLNLIFVMLLRRPRPGRLVIAGFVGSWALALHNPVPHFFVALPWLFWLVHGGSWLTALRSRWLSKRSPDATQISTRPRGWRRFRHLGWLALGYLPATLVLFGGWLYLRAVLQAEWDLAVKASIPALAPLAAAAAEGPPTSGLAHFFDLAQTFAGNLFHLPDTLWLTNRLMSYGKLILWTAPGLPFLAGIGFWRAGRQQVFLRLAGWSALATLGGYFFILISQGHGWGFRYFHQVWWALPLLGTAALLRLQREQPRWTSLVGVALLAGLLANNALRAYQIEGFLGAHLAQRPALADPRIAADKARSICFLDIKTGFYRQDLVQNDPFLREPLMTMASFGREADRALVQELAPEATLVFDDGVNTVWQVPGHASPGHASPAAAAADDQLPR